MKLTRVDVYASHDEDLTPVVKVYDEDTGSFYYADEADKYFESVTNANKNMLSALQTILNGRYCESLSERLSDTQMADIAKTAIESSERFLV